MTTNETSRRHRTPRSSRQSGGAYILVLLVLVALTVSGVALSVITQAEMQIGANERTVQRVFYAADSGLSASAAKALVSADYSSATYSLEEPGTSPLLNLRHDVEVSTFYPVLQTACNLCEINNAGEYGAQQYSRINHAVTAIAIRRAGIDATSLAQKMVSTMVDVQPWQASAEALIPLDDPAELEKIKL